jgi:hypothetical protein
MQQVTGLLHTNLFSKRGSMSLFEKAKPDNYRSPQLTLSLARR